MRALLVVDMGALLLIWGLYVYSPQYPQEEEDVDDNTMDDEAELDIDKVYLNQTPKY